MRTDQAPVAKGALIATLGASVIARSLNQELWVHLGESHDLMRFAPVVLTFEMAS
jgi:hypothetical protein